MPLIQNRDIVVIGLQQWYTSIGSNCKNIAIEFARHNRVLYVNAPLDRRTIHQEKNDSNIQYHLDTMSGKQPAVVEISPNFWNYYPDTILESLNWIPFTGVFDWFNKVNNRRFAKSIQRAITELGFKDVIVFNDNDIFRALYLKDYLRPSAYVYYSRDYLLGVPYWNKHGRTLEPKHIAKADAAVANSAFLAEMLKKYNENSHYVGQGCDIQHFNPAINYPRPVDVPTNQQPVIGYVGALKSLRLNIQLLETIAVKCPSWQLVLVGPEDEDFKQSRLHSLPNVHFTGSKSLDELPAYIQSFDVCINPQIVNQVTIGNYPLKIDEYLAMGKPVVATHTVTMEMFKDHVYLATNAEEYIAMIQKALDEDNNDKHEQRIRFAATHTWENSVKAIYQAILQYEAKHTTT
ncbi:glycosyltransferase family 1 protein [Chitinophaga silvatica]|uniref:Glycosyltransferase family 1 protein n=1 Tax=Chitinophaga silvatica TaxID=2282649 RepID=A0A3E1Y4I3_9BACT|nr:glycosyltransferase [Chitinophaga silvatica]RFS19573.1 glycosyltransferase family 1 protein [Chitinophaga silvatica]